MTIDSRVPPECAPALGQFDGGVVVERTAGEVSARCHDEQANFLALNLMHDIVRGETDVEVGRSYYAKEFLDARRQAPTPYMERLRFEPAGTEGHRLLRTVDTQLELGQHGDNLRLHALLDECRCG